MVNQLYSRGDELTLPAASLISVNTIAGNPVQSGDAVVMGDIVGVATTSAGPLPTTPGTSYVTSTTASGSIAVKCKGIINFSVTPAAAVVLGQRVYIDPATGIISDNTVKTFFGWALGVVNAGTATIIPIKLKH